MLRQGRYKGKFVREQNETVPIYLTITVSEDNAKRITIENRIFAKNGGCAFHGKSIIAQVCLLGDKLIDELNNKKCLCFIDKDKVNKQSGKQYGSGVIQLDNNDNLVEGDYWNNASISGKITALEKAS